MGVTDIKDITVAACQNWKANIKSEDNARESWRKKFSWIQDEYKELKTELEELRQRRPKAEHISKSKDSRTVRPFPSTTAGDVGWLSSRPEFLLDVLGPYPYTRKALPPMEPQPKL